MKPLATHREVLTKLSMCASAENESQREKVNRILFNITLFVIIFIFLVSSAVYMRKSVNLEEQLSALYQVVGGVMMTYVFTVAILQQPKITATIESISKLFDECKISFILFNCPCAFILTEKSIDVRRARYY